MIRTFGGALILVLGLCAPLAAQESPPAPAADEAGSIRVGEEAADATGVTPEEPVAAGEGGEQGGGIRIVPLDYSGWEEVAQRAEGVVSRGQGSAFVLRRLRADLVEWRDLFLGGKAVNARRIQTVTGQLGALGPAPAEGEPPEAAEVTERRAALEAQLAELRAPARLAEEAHARADGLIREIDVLLRGQNRAQLMERGPSPLSPAIWAEVWHEARSRVTGLWKELTVSLASPARRQVLAENWFRVLAYLALGAGLLLRGTRVTASVAAALEREFPRGAPVWRFLLSLGRVVLPLAGVVALVAAFEASGMFGFRATRLLQALPAVAFFYVVARWLAERFFGPDPEPGLAARGHPATREELYRLVIGLGVVLAILAGAERLIDTGDIGPQGRAAFVLPFEIAIAVLLFRFGRAVSAPRAEPEGEDGQPRESVLLRRQFVWLGGRLIMAGSVIAPVLSILGYALAARSLLYPTVLTLALLGVVLLLQHLLTELYAFVARDERVRRDSLVPMIGGFILLLVATPIAALIWGARVEDLTEIWTRFRDGYAIGDTRISPMDIATFLIVFGIGYTLTRILQGVLRSSILPRTRLDVGAQNAIVSGLAYVGIFLAAIIAIGATGLNLSNVAIVAGALSVGIGFGLQTIVSNFVSGIILLIERPISEGDWIEVGGRMGYVRNISVRSTRIETFDRTDVIVPNADLVSGQVVNWTRGNLIGRVIVAVGVSYGSDIERVTAILREIAESHPLVILSPPPVVVLVGLASDSMNFEIRAIIRDINFSLSVKSEMNVAIATRFRAEGIEIPFPQRDVWVRNAADFRHAPRDAAGPGDTEGEGG